MSKSIIYKATNVKTNKSYIGQTTQTLKKRQYQHINDAKKGRYNSYFHRTIRKYGPESFTWEILFEGECSSNKLNDLEIFYIGYYDTFNNGYNLTIGGEGQSGQMNNFSRTKMSDLKRQQMMERSNETKLYTLDKDGLNIYQLNGKKAKETCLSNIDENGLNIHKQVGKKARKTKLTTIDENGLNMYQVVGKKASITRLNWTDEQKADFNKKYSGANGSNSKKYLLISPNNQKIGCYGNIKEICKKYNLSLSVIRKYINKGKISIKIRSNSKQESINCIDWEIIRL